MTDFESLIPRKARVEMLAAEAHDTPREPVKDGITFRWLIREKGVPPEKWPDGEWLEAVYSPAEWEDMRKLRKLMDSPDKKTRMDAFRSACTIHELKALGDARTIEE